MTQYRMVWNTPTGGIPWQYDYEMVGGEHMALDYAVRIAQNDRGFRAGAMSMSVFRLGDEKYIAELILNEPTVRVRYP